MTNKRNPNLEGWNRCTELCVDVKTFLRNDRITKMGKAYTGMLTHDAVDHFSFIETAPQVARRNPRVFDGEFVTITRHDDGTLRPNLKPMKVDRLFSVDDYSIRVMGELRGALKGLVGE